MWIKLNSGKQINSEKVVFIDARSAPHKKWTVHAESHVFYLNESEMEDLQKAMNPAVAQVGIATESVAGTGTVASDFVTPIKEKVDSSSSFTMENRKKINANNILCVILWTDKPKDNYLWCALMEGKRVYLTDKDMATAIRMNPKIHGATETDNAHLENLVKRWGIDISEKRVATQFGYFDMPIPEADQIYKSVLNRRRGESEKSEYADNLPEIGLGQTFNVIGVPMFVKHLEWDGLGGVTITAKPKL